MYVYVWTYMMLYANVAMYMYVHVCMHAFDA